jgi:hypothetical protein
VNVVLEKGQNYSLDLRGKLTKSEDGEGKLRSTMQRSGSTRREFQATITLDHETSCSVGNKRSLKYSYRIIMTTVFKYYFVHKVPRLTEYLGLDKCWAIPGKGIVKVFFTD